MFYTNADTDVTCEQGFNVWSDNNLRTNLSFWASNPKFILPKNQLCYYKYCYFFWNFSDVKINLSHIKIYTSGTNRKLLIYYSSAIGIIVKDSSKPLWNLSGRKFLLFRHFCYIEIWIPTSPLYFVVEMWLPFPAVLDWHSLLVDLYPLAAWIDVFLLYRHTAIPPNLWNETNGRHN